MEPLTSIPINRSDSAKRLEAIILEVLTGAAGPMTSGQIFSADSRFTDKKSYHECLDPIARP